MNEIFEIRGKKNNFHFTAFCRILFLKCKTIKTIYNLVVPCVDPTPPNGQVTITGQSSQLQINRIYLVNTVATFICNSDSVMIGSASSTCQPSGIWNPPVPRCILGNVLKIKITEIFV